ncbi:uncharacterized protein BDR25DRAFT_353844 [Lindgomyces ingoldianus]|uniref:Uncharacterized protein n=1 Tax=Lindgomyces ingoldianus TaxID=673940 RepID=A0ACB6QZY9_9PLEO|nr:uncharacterized protein BDR25DRAFT_353844 [Lindgomyces ingoldianus]KAF2472105.1 hypothetical protein BDR25DRAFT_353844 [Lindgomyces ingoldianus]
MIAYPYAIPPITSASPHALTTDFSRRLAPTFAARKRPLLSRDPLSTFPFHCLQISGSTALTRDTTLNFSIKTRTPGPHKSSCRFFPILFIRRTRRSIDHYHTSDLTSAVFHILLLSTYPIDPAEKNQKLHSGTRAATLNYLYPPRFIIELSTQCKSAPAIAHPLSSTLSPYATFANMSSSPTAPNSASKISNSLNPLQASTVPPFNRPAGRNVHIYDASDSDTVLGGMIITVRGTHAKFYLMVEILFIFTSTFFLRDEGETKMERDDHPLQPGKYYIVDSACSFEVNNEPWLVRTISRATGTRVAAFCDAVHSRDRRCIIFGECALTINRIDFWSGFEGARIFPLDYRSY